jgi:hypothetical protein
MPDKYDAAFPRNIRVTGGAGMDQSVIVQALAAGGAAGGIATLQDDVKAAVMLSYGRLRDLVKRRFHGNDVATAILAQYESKREVYAGALADQLAQTGADKDPELLAAARELLNLINDATPAGSNNVIVTNSSGVQVGNHSIQINSFRD